MLLLHYSTKHFTGRGKESCYPKFNQLQLIQGLQPTCPTLSFLLRHISCICHLGHIKLISMDQAGKVQASSWPGTPDPCLCAWLSWHAAGWGGGHSHLSKAVELPWGQPFGLWDKEKKKTLTHIYSKENVSAKNCFFEDHPSHLCVSLVRAGHKIFPVKKPYLSLWSCSAEIVRN